MCPSMSKLSFFECILNGDNSQHYCDDEEPPYRKNPPPPAATQSDRIWLTGDADPGETTMTHD
jgi:hypothetical protein